MQASPELLRELLEYHYDRREWLYQFLEQLTPDEFTRDLGAGWKSIRNTLVHCLEAEEYWVQYAIRKQARPGYDYREFPDPAAVRRLAGQVRERTLAWFAGLTAEDLGRVESKTDSDGCEVRFTLLKALLHVITHDTHHRGQVLLLARQLGYTPPDLDLL